MNNPQCVQGNDVNYFKLTNPYDKQRNCLLVGREIARCLTIVAGAVTAVSLLASMIFGCVAASSPYMPMVCFVAGLISLGLAGTSAIAAMITLVSGIVFGVLGTKFKQY